jgi:hypothetical protein
VLSPIPSRHAQALDFRPLLEWEQLWGTPPLQPTEQEEEPSPFLDLYTTLSPPTAHPSPAMELPSPTQPRASPPTPPNTGTWDLGMPWFLLDSPRACRLPLDALHHHGSRSATLPVTPAASVLGLGDTDHDEQGLGARGWDSCFSAFPQGLGDEDEGDEAAGTAEDRGDSCFPWPASPGARFAPVHSISPTLILGPPPSPFPAVGVNTSVLGDVPHQETSPSSARRGMGRKRNAKGVTPAAVDAEVPASDPQAPEPAPPSKRARHMGGCLS